MRFSARTSWSGSTAEGWDRYDRTHTARGETGTDLCELAHEHCNVAKSLSCPVEIEPQLV